MYEKITNFILNYKNNSFSLLVIEAKKHIKFHLI